MGQHRPIWRKSGELDPANRPCNAPINPARGERHGRAKLTAEQVRAARARYVWQCRVNGANALAREAGVTKGAMQAVVEGRTWRHVLDGGA